MTTFAERRRFQELKAVWAADEAEVVSEFESDGMDLPTFDIIYGFDQAAIDFGLCGPSDAAELTPSRVRW